MGLIKGIARFRPTVTLTSLEPAHSSLATKKSSPFHLPNFGPTPCSEQLRPADHYETQVSTLHKLTLISDCRLDNREDLIRKLSLATASEIALPDSRIILKAYQKWGKSFLEHMIGAFAFALLDPENEIILLARDQKGERPLFYHQNEQQLSFASMPDGLLSLPWIEKRLNERKLAEFLVLDHTDHSTSLYEGIQRLPPGHLLEVTRQRTTLQGYWRLDLDQRIHYRTDEEYVEHGREILDACVRSSLRNASPVGAMMSGGLDSSAVAATAAKILAQDGKTLPTFTEVPDKSIALPTPTQTRYWDESPFIHDIHALHPNLSLNFVESAIPDLYQNFERRLASLQGPYRNPFNQIWLEDIAQRASEQGIRTLLTGQSGNMSFSYDGLWNLPRLFKSLRWKTLSRSIRQTSAKQDLSPWSLLRSKLIAPLCPAPLWNGMARLRARGRPAWEAYSAINPEFARVHGIEQSFREGRFKIPSDSRIARANASIGYDYFGEYLQALRNMFGVELRDPLGDIRLLQWCLAIPESQYLQNGETRWLAKRIAADRLPANVLNNKRRGQQAAGWAHSLEKQIPALKRELDLAKDSPLASRALDLHSMETLLKNWPGARFATPQTYRFKLCRGITTARFLRMLENS